MVSVTDHLVPYHERLKNRDTDTLNLVVVHSTELPDLTTAREFGERIVYTESGTGVSGHYYIDRDGSIYRYVADDRVAQHVIGHNQTSIGIELVNLGRYPHWYSSANQECTESFTSQQIKSLKDLLSYLKSQYPQLSRIARHSDLDTTLIPAEDDSLITIRRKVDPGPLFPWDEIREYWANL